MIASVQGARAARARSKGGSAGQAVRDKLNHGGLEWKVVTHTHTASAGSLGDGARQVRPAADGGVGNRRVAVVRCCTKHNCQGVGERSSAALGRRVAGKNKADGEQAGVVADGAANRGPERLWGEGQC